MIPRLTYRQWSICIGMGALGSTLLAEHRSLRMVERKLAEAKVREMIDARRPAGFVLADVPPLLATLYPTGPAILSDKRIPHDERQDDEEARAANDH